MTTQNVFLTGMLLCFSLTFSFSQDMANNPSENPGTETGADQVPVEKLMKQGTELLADNYFMDALAIWQQVLEQHPDHPNANFKAGLCYRNSYDQPMKALPYFRKAVKDMTDNYTFTHARQKQAPQDALYFLGEAYLINNKPDSALNYFMLYRDHFNGNPPINTDRKIFMSINAKRNVNHPRDVKITQLGGGVNTNYPETHPVLTIDNSIMLFTARKPRKDGSNEGWKDPSTGQYHEDIYIAKRGEDGKFRDPGLFKLSSDGNEAPLCFSADGTELYLRKKVNNRYDIYKSVFEDGVWTEAEPVTKINSPFDEQDVSLSGDGSLLYFSSNRPGGKGKFDIYRCVKKENGKWSQPENLGSAINTAHHEKYPFIHPNGQTLFFSSDGYSTCMGGLDIYFASVDESGSWGHPQNLGYPINTTRDDINYYIVQGGIRYYATLDDEQSYDIFKIEGGGFAVENIAAGKDVVTLTQEMDVTEVMEVEKEVEKEVEVVQTVEKEVTKETEVEVVDLTALDELEQSMKEKATARVKEETRQIQAEAQKAQAEAEKAKAEAEKMLAEAEIKKAEAEKDALQKAQSLEKILAKKEALAASSAKEAESLLEKARIDSANAAKALRQAELAFEEECGKVQIARAESKKALKEAQKTAAEKLKEARQKAEAELEKLKKEYQKATAEKEQAVAEAEKTAKKAEQAAQQALAEAEQTTREKIALQKKQAEEAVAKAKKEQAEAAAKAHQEQTKLIKAVESKLKTARENATLQTRKLKEKKALLQMIVDNQAMLDTLEDVNFNVENIQAQVKQAEAEARSAQAEAEHAQAELEKVQAEVSRTEAEAQKAGAVAQQKAEEARKAGAEAIAQSKSTAQAEAEAASKAAQKTIEQAKAQQEKALVEQEKSRAQALEAQAKKAEAEKEVAQAELDKIKKKREMAEEEENIAIAEAIKKKGEAIQTTQDNIQKSKEAAIEEAKAAQSRHEKEIKAIEKTIRELETRSKTAEKLIETARSQIKHAEARIKEAEARKKEADVEIAKIESR